MSYTLIALAAFLAAGLTLFSGFGLGTILLPIFTLFMPVEVAVAATAVVHGANNLLKTVVFGRRASPELVLKFGLPAVVAAFVGAELLGIFSGLKPLATYSLGAREAVITPLKILIGFLMLLFAFVELSPRLRDLRISQKYLIPGGFLSGFFGGLSGHQGALRSAFLAKAGVSTEAFIGTNAWIALFVDVARLAVYARLTLEGELHLQGPREWTLVSVGILAAFFGVLAGRRYVGKIAMRKIQKLIGLMLILIALAVAAGII